MTSRRFDNRQTVARCVPTQDGNWLVITTTSNTASSPVELPEGARIRITGGIATRAPK